MKKKTQQNSTNTIKVKQISLSPKLALTFIHAQQLIISLTLRERSKFKMVVYGLRTRNAYSFCVS